MGPYPEATAVFDIDSIGLTNLVSRLNRGLDPGGNPIGQPTRFVIGVGVNPAAPDLEREIKRFAWKVEAGAEWPITQPVFDLAQLDRFLGRVEELPDSDRRRDLAAGVAPKRGVPGQRGAGHHACRTRCWSGCAARVPRARRQALAEGVRISQEMLDRGVGARAGGTGVRAARSRAGGARGLLRGRSD